MTPQYTLFIVQGGPTRRTQVASGPISQICSVLLDKLQLGDSFSSSDLKYVHNIFSELLEHFATPYEFFSSVEKCSFVITTGNRPGAEVRKSRRALLNYKILVSTFKLLGKDLKSDIRMWFNFIDEVMSASKLSDDEIEQIHLRVAFKKWIKHTYELENSGRSSSAGSDSFRSSTPGERSGSGSASETSSTSYYTAFMHERTEKLKRENPSLSPSERFKLAYAAWKETNVKSPEVYMEKRLAELLHTEMSLEEKLELIRDEMEDMKS